MLKICFVFFNIIISFNVSAENVIFGQIHVTKENGDKVDDASNLVVFVEDVKGQFKPPTTHAVMASKDKEFVPPILAILKGTIVDFPNIDLIMHNVFSLSKTKPFDLGLYDASAGKSVTFNNPGLVKVYCNIHEKMVAHILILDNPFFALTDAAGKIKITNVPNGNYKVTVWHRFGNQQSRDVVLTGKDEVKVGFNIIKGKEIDIEIKQINKSIKHKNKWGQDYKSKY